MEYQGILSKAYNCSDPALRMVYIAAFNIAQYHGTFDRMTKPYNPILGETNELKTSEFKYISEQVSHHPPISACYAESNQGHYKLWLNTNMRSNFWGASFEASPLGLVHIKLENLPGIYTASRPSTFV